MWWQARNKRGDNSCVRQESHVPTQNKRRKSNRRKEKQSRKTSVRRSSKLQLVAQASNRAVRCITSFLENSRRQTSNKDEEAINSLLREAVSVCTTRPSKRVKEDGEGERYKGCHIRPLFCLFVLLFTPTNKSSSQRKIIHQRCPVMITLALLKILKSRIGAVKIIATRDVSLTAQKQNLNKARLYTRFPEKKCKRSANSEDSFRAPAPILIILLGCNIVWWREGKCSLHWGKECHTNKILRRIVN